MVIHGDEGIIRVHYYLDSATHYLDSATHFTTRMMDEMFRVRTMTEERAVWEA